MKNEYKIIKIGGAALEASLDAIIEAGRYLSLQTYGDLKNVAKVRELSNEFSQLVDFINDLESKQNHIIVISAFGRTTRLLKNAAAVATANLDDALISLDEAFSIFFDIIIQNKNSPEAKQIELIINKLRGEVTALLASVNKTQELTARTLDRIMAYGERASSELLHHYLRSKRHCLMLRSRDFMITNDNYGNAKPLREEIKSKLMAFLDKNSPQLLITEGFTGVTQSGVITTMGFESSNLTTALICDALGAKSMQIITNVPGIRTADPKLFEKTKLIDKMSYAAATAASKSGLKLLHEESLRIASKCGTEISYTNLDSDQVTIVSGGGTSALPLFIYNSEQNWLSILNFTAEKLLNAISTVITNANYELKLNITDSNVKNKAQFRLDRNDNLRPYQALHDEMIKNIG